MKTSATSHQSESSTSEGPLESTASAFRRRARNAFRPDFHTALVSQTCSGIKDEQVPVMVLIREIEAQIRKVSRNDMRRPEAMLVAQAHTLEMLFTTLACKAHANMGHNADVAEMYMKLALKAQSQCRATLETLAVIKNPVPIAFVSQANIGQAVQVNNTTPAASRAGKTELEQNKLMETSDGQRLDARAPRTSGKADQILETVATINGAKESRRKGPR